MNETTTNEKATPEKTATYAVTTDTVRADAMMNTLIRVANDELGAQGFTEHGHRHASLVSHISYNILSRLGRPERSADLAGIAGYLHDMGNVVNRLDHATAGAVIALNHLIALGMDPAEAGVVAGAIGNHEERVGEPVSDPSAAVIIADKSDVHRTRVRNQDPATFDIHDRVNFAAQHSFVRVDAEHKIIALEITIDTTKASVLDYFEIFLNRMLFIRKAAQFLGCELQLIINKTRML